MTRNGPATRFGCAVCRRPLNRLDIGGQPRWLHVGADTGAAPHQPQPVPAEQIHDLAQACDFCSEPDPVWLYRSDPITVLAVADDRALQINLGERWAACTGCAELIETRDAAGLLARAAAGVSAHRGQAPIREIRTIHAAFLAIRRPGREPLHPAGAAAGLSPRAGSRRGAACAARSDAAPIPVLRPAVLPKVRDRLADWWRQHAAEPLRRAVSTGRPVPAPAHLLDRPHPPHTATGRLTTPAEAAAYTAAMAGSLTHAALYWIDPTFTKLATSASTKLPNLHIDRDQVPAASGLLVWGTPIAEATLLHGQRQDLVAATWWRIPAGWWLQLYAPAGAGLTGTALQHVRERIGWLAPIGTGHALPDHNPGSATLVDGVREGPPPGVEHAATATLVATWLLSGQDNLADTATEGADRAVRRAYARANRPAPEVRLVQLRTRNRPDATTSTADGDRPTRVYSHQWWVEGHFRDQLYGPNRSLRKRIFVAGHLAGPDDKPVRLRPSVRVLGSTRTSPHVAPDPEAERPDRTS